jgi:hypothetical protein
VVAAALVVGVGGEVGMEALGDFAEEGFQVVWFGVVWILWLPALRVKMRDARRGVLGFALLGFTEEAFGIFHGLGGDLEVGDAGVPFVELDVEDADLADVAAFKAVELVAKACEGGFAGGELGAEGGEPGAAEEELGVLGGGESKEGCGGRHVPGWMIDGWGWQGLVWSFAVEP